MTESVTISAPSRLHFGLFSIGEPDDERSSFPAAARSDSHLANDADPVRQFGGIGLMVQSPRTIVKVSRANCLKIEGPGATVARRAAAVWFRHCRSILDSHALGDERLESLEQLPLRIQIQTAPPPHCGLGSGTQLALGTTMAVMQQLNLPLPHPEVLAIAAGRGKRSAIGSHGFSVGGFLVDRGKTNRDELAPLDFRADFPSDWPVLIIMFRGRQGLSGTSENDAFRGLPPVSRRQREEMVRLVRDQIVPAILGQDYDCFASALYSFGRTSGMFFREIQGGPYNGPEVAGMVAQIRETGVQAVGQTSWGPSVYAILDHEERANDLVQRLTKKFGEKIEIIRTRADNQGFRSDKPVYVSQITG